MPQPHDKVAAAPARFALYGELPGASELELIHIEDIRSRARLYDWTITPHSHRDMWQFIHVAKGGAEATLEDARIALAPRSVLAIPDGVVHGFAFEEDTLGWVLSTETRLFETAAFAPLRGLLAGRGFGVTKLDLSAAENRDLSFLFSRLHEEFVEAREGRALMLDSLTSALLVLMLRNAPGKSGPGVAAPEGARLAAGFRDLVNKRFREHWSIDRYAEALAVSQSQLSRTIRRATGQSPAAIINARLLLEAQRNLHYTEATAAQIGFDLGFQDPAYFSRFFKRLTGVTPRRYRLESRRNG
ncbi:helix-turn-helix domain-containing protein [Hyphococcus sp.]|uniref:helix-turn-helix domain-containing protein n=1 Tax=Hyphococcus sp. TaxID=2038636 RepID=UPI003D140AAD